MTSESYQSGGEGGDKTYTLRSRFVPAGSELCCGNYLEYVCSFLFYGDKPINRSKFISQVKRVNKEVGVQFHLV